MKNRKRNAERRNAKKTKRATRAKRTKRTMNNEASRKDMPSATHAISRILSILERPEVTEEDAIDISSLITVISDFLEEGSYMNGAWILTAIQLLLEKSGITDDEMNPITDLRNELMERGMS